VGGKGFVSRWVVLAQRDKEGELRFGARVFVFGEPGSRDPGVWPHVSPPTRSPKYSRNQF